MQRKVTNDIAIKIWNREGFITDSHPNHNTACLPKFISMVNPTKIRLRGYFDEIQLRLFTDAGGDLHEDKYFCLNEFKGEIEPDIKSLRKFIKYFFKNRYFKFIYYDTTTN